MPKHFSAKWYIVTYFITMFRSLYRTYVTYY